jgi:hypothetical protein
MLALQMSLMASLSNPYIVEYKDGWVDEVQYSTARKSSPRALIQLLLEPPKIPNKLPPLRVAVARPNSS